MPHMSTRAAEPSSRPHCHESPVRHSPCLSAARAAADRLPAEWAYARLLPDLPSFHPSEEFLYALGGAGGLCDCGGRDDEMASLGKEAAGWPFFGQFIAHDITADRSALASHVDPGRLRNARSPRLDLESLYGDGPVGQPFLFRREDPAKLLTAPGGLDLPRNAEGTAIIGDPRNDSHLFMSQMHLAFVRAHNVFVDRARAQGVSHPDVFETAARELRWTYQTAVVEEFLPRLIGRELTEQLLVGDRRYFRPSTAFIPLEFADAAFRYGHSQMRHRYAPNSDAAPVPLMPDLLGFRPVSVERVVDWSVLFDTRERPAAQRAKKIDGRLVGGLMALPAAMTSEVRRREFHSLAVRDLQRGQGVGLPSGEAVARCFGVTPLSPEEIGATRIGWSGETPLWYYVLREAEVRANGDRLGPVGGRIVGEVLIGLLDLDVRSVRFAPPDWRPAARLAELLSWSEGAA